jgi:hypothetical protein
MAACHARRLLAIKRRRQAESFSGTEFSGAKRDQRSFERERSRILKRRLAIFVR